jgi:serine/threonine-protein kinase RsbW
VTTLNNNNNKPADITLKIPAQADYISALSVALHSLCFYATGKEDFAIQFQQALVEALNNVVEHAYNNQAGHEISVCYYQEHNQIRIEIIDSGESMTTLPEPVLPDFDAESGRGWWIIHCSVDNYHYQVIEQVQHSNTNILTLIKHF